MTRDIYHEVTNGIVAELTAGTRPWVKPWSETPGLNIPANAVTGRPYSGINTLLLWTTRRNGWPQPRFLTFKQALEAGGHVRKGEHGRRVVFVKDLVKKTEEEEEDLPVIHMLKTFTVFNIAQCDGLPDMLTAPPKAGAAFLCAEFAIDSFIPHAAYIKNYVKLLEDNPKAIFTAASKAQAAVDYLRQLILVETGRAA